MTDPSLAAIHHNMVSAPILQSSENTGKSEPPAGFFRPSGGPACANRPVCVNLWRFENIAGKKKMSLPPKRLLPAPSPLYVPPARREGELWEMAICGELTDKQPEQIGRLTEVPRGSRGIIYFDSGGGSVYAGLALATVIRLRGLKTIGVVAGECSSATILPFAACAERFVTPHSTLLFHPMRWQSEEDVRFEEAVEWARHFKFMEEDTDRLLARLFGVTESKLAEWTRPGRFVTGAELVKAGLAKELDLFAGDLWTQIAGKTK